MMTAMSEEESRAVDDKVNAPHAGDAPAGQRDGTARWVRRGVMLLVVIVAAFVIYQVAASFLPRWWAQRMKDQVHGGFTRGILWGLFYGSVFTFIPITLLFQTRRRFLNWKAKIVVVIIALLLATPNWLTLSIVAGNSSAAHAGQRIMDVDVPAFRWATLIGVVIGAVVAIGMSSTSMLLSRRRKQVKELREQVKRHNQSKVDEEG